MPRKIIAACVIVIFAAVSVCAGDGTPDYRALFNQTHQAGIRLGVWGNQGEMPASFGVLPPDSLLYRTNFKSASFYFEAYLGLRLIRYAMAEISVGIVNRGDVSASLGGINDIGNITLYPILVRLKLYPLASIASRMQPYVTFGGGLYYGRNNIQFSNDYLAPYRETSRTNFNLSAGGGVDWPLSRRIALDFQASYMPIKFSGDLFTVRDYSAWTVTVGVKHLFSSFHNK